MADVPLMNNPMTTEGDVIYGGTSGVPTRLGIGSDGEVLTLASGVPSWEPTAATLPAPWAVVPYSGTNAIADQGMAANNQAVITPVDIMVSVEVTGIMYQVVNQSGNISVALYDESLDRLATSGSVACPAAGIQTTNFTAAYTAAPGRYWIGFSSSTTAATFKSANLSGNATLLVKTAGTHHPLPDPFVVVSSASRCPVLVGLITGGWAP